MHRLNTSLLVVLALSLCACETSKTVTQDPATLKSYQKDARRGVFTVKGSVYHPGTFSLKSGESIPLSEALRKAGGTISGDSFDSGASLTNIKVYRIDDGAVVAYTLDVWHETDGKDFLIKTGDHIYVPEVIF